MLAVVFVLLIWADNSGISRMIAGNEIKEKRPKSIYWSICIVIGGGLLILVIGVTPVILLLDMSFLMWNGLWEVF